MRTWAAAAACSCASWARYERAAALWTSSRVAVAVPPSECSAPQEASGGAASRTITRASPLRCAAGIVIVPARTCGCPFSPPSRWIGVNAAEAEDAATSPTATERTRGRRKTTHSSRRSVRVETMFEGKNALVLGVANKRSIAWAIAKRLADGGAQLAFTFQGERIEKNVRDLAATVSSPLVTELDVRDDAAIERVFGEVGRARSAASSTSSSTRSRSPRRKISRGVSPTRRATGSGWPST